MAASAPFRVRDLAGVWHDIDLAPDTSTADAKDIVAGVVRLAPGTFILENDRGGGAAIRGGLAGDWHVVLLLSQPITPPKATAGVDADGGEGVRTDFSAAPLALCRQHTLPLSPFSSPPTQVVTSGLRYLMRCIQDYSHTFLLALAATQQIAALAYYYRKW